MRALLLTLLLIAGGAGPATATEAPPREPMPLLPQTTPPPPPRLAPEPSRGQLLYENHCRGCHESVVHITSKRKVRTLPALRDQVSRWAATAKLPWGVAEIEDVANYLDRRYYQFNQREPRR
jgi:hypothetical protein